MKLTLKKIHLKEITLEDISANSNQCDVQKFINYIKEHLKKANDLLNCKIESLSDIELYEKLREIYDFTIDKNDYLRVLSKIYGKHYTDFIYIKTNMMDNDGNNIMYHAAVGSSKLYLNESTLDLNSIRNLTKKNDLLIVKTIRILPENVKKEKYENHQFIDIDITDCNLDEDSELFLYFIELIKKDILVKDILYDIKLYIEELMFQAKSITNLSKDEDNVELALIGERYKKALDNCFDDQSISKKRKISVPKHKKRK